VLIPKENAKDLADIPPSIKRGLHLIQVEHMDEVLVSALSIGEPELFLRDGDHDFDDIHELPHRERAIEVPAQPGVN
jgi:hypothetical protein